MFSGGQPYLVNALARWCVEEIHHGDYSQPITGADMEEAKEKIIREQGTHLDSLLEKLEEPRVRAVVEPVMLGGTVDRTRYAEDVSYCLDLGLLVDDKGSLKPANPIYAETIGRYLTRGMQSEIHMKCPENPWVVDGGLDMAGLMAAFQQFWRENADANAVPYDYREAYPHLVLGYYEKSHEKAHRQVLGYMDRLGQSEGWLVVADSDLTKPWDEKISSEDIPSDGKTIHLVRC